MSSASKLHTDNNVLDGFWIFPILVASVLLVGVGAFGWWSDDDTIEPKPYDPMTCYVITAEGERVDCP